MESNEELEIYTKEHLKELVDLRHDAIEFYNRLDQIGAIAPAEEKMLKIFLDLIDKEINEVAFYVELEAVLRGE